MNLASAFTIKAEAKKEVTAMRRVAAILESALTLSLGAPAFAASAPEPVAAQAHHRFHHRYHRHRHAARHYSRWR